MREYAWNEKAILKSAFAGPNAISLHQAKIPLIGGSYIIPPYVSRNKQYYKLVKEGRQAPYKKIIHILKKSAEKYAFLPTPDVPERIKEIIEEQTKDYDAAVQPGSSMFEELQNLAFILADEAEKLGIFEPENVLDIEFSNNDLSINKFLEDVVMEASGTESENHLAKLYIDSLKKEKIKESKYLIQQLSYKFEELLHVEKSMYYSYMILLSYAQKSGQTPLIYEFVHALFQYKFDTVNKSQIESQIKILYNAINNAYKLLKNGYFVHNPTRRFTWEPVFYARLLVISTVLGKVFARYAHPNGIEDSANAKFSCYKRFENVRFKNLAGFSPEIAEKLDQFFDESAKPFVLKIDGKYREADELESFYCQNDFEVMVNTLEITNGMGTTISFDYGTHPKQLEGSPERFQFPLLDMAEKMENTYLAKIMAGTFMSLGDMESTIETLRTKNNFLKIYKNNKLVNTFAFTYSAKLGPQQRGEINQIYIGRIHKAEEAKNINKIYSKYNEVMDNITIKADELYTEAVKTTKESDKEFIDTFNKQLTLFPIAKAFAELEKPQICDINMLYFDNLNIFETSEGLYTRKIDDVLLYDKYLYDHGHIHVNYSKILSNLQYMMLKKKYKLKNIDILQKKHIEVATKERLLATQMSTVLKPLFHDYNLRFESNKYSISYMDKLAFLKKIVKKRVTEEIGDWNLMQKALLQKAQEIFAEALNKQKNVWSRLYENLTKEKFNNNTINDLIEQVINNKIAKTSHEILSEFINMLVIGEYLKQHVYDEDVEFKVFDELNVEGKNRIEKTKFIETLLNSSNNNEKYPLIVLINRYGKNIIATALNSKRSSTDAAGMSDYGFDVITLNQAVSDIGMMSYSIEARTDVFSFYTNMYDNNLSPTYLYNIDHFCEATVDNYVKIITNLIGKSKFSLKVLRGLFLKIGVKNDAASNLSYAYIMPEASARKIFDDMLAEDYGQRSLTLSRPLKEEELQPIPIIDMTLHFDGSIVPSEQLFRVEILEITFHTDIINEYVKSVVQRTKEKEINISEAAKLLYNNKKFGNEAFKKYIKSVWSRYE